METIIQRARIYPLILQVMILECRGRYDKHYGNTFETFVEIDLTGNQMIALAIINPLTSEDLKFD